MWLLLSLLGGAAALSMSDLFTAQDLEDESSIEVDGSPQDEGFQGGWSQGDGTNIGPGFPDEDSTDTPVQQVSPADGDSPALGKFDGLGLRIHSSDLFPDPDPDAPFVLTGDEDDDYLRGDALDDVLSGEGGNDTLVGSGGADWLDGGTGHDSLIGGEGADSLFGGVGNDTLIGGIGNDLLVSGTGDNTLMAGDGDDTLVGEAGSSFLNGGDGNDVLFAGAGNQLHGGGGNDAFLLSDRLEPSEPVRILDYTAEEDLILLQYDADEGAPDLQITFDSDTPDLAEIRLAGEILATVANAASLTAADISLVAEPGMGA